MKRYPISAVILAKNEEKNIQKALESVDFCSEIIVMDDDSTDNTIKKAQSSKLKAQNQNSKLKIYKKQLNGDFAGQRNYAMTQTSYEWILFLDADEEISENLKFEILNLKFDKNAYYIKRRDFWWGSELRYGEIKKLRNLGVIRLVKKGSGNWMGNVHEEFKLKNQSANWRTKLKTLNGYINHYPHPTVKEFLQDINTYSTLRAKELLNQGVSTNIAQIMLYPFFKFILNYFIYLGFLDGPPGFAYAFFMSFHSFLVRAKLYQYKRFSQINS